MQVGNLKLLILRLVSNHSLSGYDLMGIIKEKTGCRPSPGSMYPILDDLKNKKLVKPEIVGRSKRYSITKKGMSSLNDFTKHKKVLMKRIKTSICVFCAITGQTERECVEMLHQECNKAALARVCAGKKEKNN